MRIPRVACIAFLFCCAALNGQENTSNSTAWSPAEQDALKVLNDSDWAQTVTPTLQNTPCTHQDPAFPGLFSEEKAAALDARSHIVVDNDLKPDTSDYLIRFESAKPVQAAVERLIAIGPQWSGYGAEQFPVEQFDKPTDLPSGRYNIADMITVAVILKHPGRDAATLFDYGYFDNGRKFPAHGFLVFTCAALRTTNGQVHARVAPATGRDATFNFKVLRLSFPRLIDGKPLISGVRQKVEFRLVTLQRVFEATFYVTGDDVLDGSEKSLYLPGAFTDPVETARQ